MNELDDFEVYLNDLRLDILVRFGMRDRKILSPCSARDGLDAAIIGAAGEFLPKSEKFTLFYALTGGESFEEIQEIFLSSHGRELDLQTVKTYARRASGTLGNNATKSEALKEWLTQWEKM